MSTVDYSIASQGAAAVRAELNATFAAIVSKNSNATEPSDTFAYMWWYDTNTDILKIRNADDDAWINFVSFDQTNDKWYFASMAVGSGVMPVGGIGLALTGWHGPNASASGPHHQVTTDADNYPLFGMLNWGHDNISMGFDCYFDGSNWKSSDAGSNYRMAKVSDYFVIQGDNGIAQGSTLSLDTYFKIDKYGHILLPFQSAFSAYNPTSILNVTGNGAVFTCRFATEIFDQNSDYNNGTYTYTAPIALKMVNAVMMTFYATAGIGYVDSLAVTSNRIYRFTRHGDTSSSEVTPYLSISASFIADYDAADTCYINCSMTGLGGNTADYQGNPGAITAWQGVTIC